MKNKKKMFTVEEKRAMRFYMSNAGTIPPDLKKEIINAEEERNPGFLSRIGAALNPDNDDIACSAAFSLTCRDLIGHASVLHRGRKEVDNSIDYICNDVSEALDLLIAKHGFCFSAIRAAFADYFAAWMAAELDPRKNLHRRVCDDDPGCQPCEPSSGRRGWD